LFTINISLLSKRFNSQIFPQNLIFVQTMFRLVIPNAFQWVLLLSTQMTIVHIFHHLEWTTIMMFLNCSDIIFPQKISTRMLIRLIPLSVFLSFLL
jgi:hypothetical protein